MNLEKIRNAKTEIIGKNIQYQEEITSTHMVAKQIANDSKNQGLILLTELQTEGIGTHGRIWYTGKYKNIAMTIILKPNCTVNKFEGLTKTIAISMQETIKELYNYKLAIKEPNDLLLNGKKICGILTEINTVATKVNYLIISLGFNVNEEKFSDETRTIATSLKREYGIEFEREEIIKRFIEILEIKMKEDMKLL